MQNGGKCQISDICPRSAPCISGPVSSMLEEMRKGAEEDAGSSITSRCTARWARGRVACPSVIEGICRHRIPGAGGTPQPRPWRTGGGWASVPLPCYPDGGQHPSLRDGAGAPWGTPYWSDPRRTSAGCDGRGAGSPLSRDGTEDCRKELKLCAKTLKNHPFLSGWPR